MTTDSFGAADTIVLGGRVITMHPGIGDHYQGLALKDGRIIRLIRRDGSRGTRTTAPSRTETKP